MGIATAIFITNPDKSLICPICLDILDDPKFIKCGHAFCSECIKQSRQRTNGRCPTCRSPVIACEEDLIPAHALRELIGNLKVRCKNNALNNIDDNIDEERHNTRRRRLNHNSEYESGPTCIIINDNNTNENTPNCEWVGTLSSWKKHANNECLIQKVDCDVDGCNFRCARYELKKHQNGSICMSSRIDKIVEKKLKNIVSEYDKKLEDMSNQMTQMYLISFCRSWMEIKPDPLFDFVVYRSKKNVIRSLLCGIPGPKRTCWEGGLYPLLIEYKFGINRPPICRFPNNFHHVNLYQNGTVCISTLSEDAGWHLEITLPEILFDIQQLLAHPNEYSPAQQEAYTCYVDDRRKYQKIAKNFAKYYNPDSFLQLAQSAEWCDTFVPDTTWESVDSLSLRSQTPPVMKKQPDIPYSSIKEGSECSCSCCAWAHSNYYDSNRKEMRFLYGIP